MPFEPLPSTLAQHVDAHYGEFLAELRGIGDVPPSRAVFKRAAELKLLTHALPAEVGGGGADPFAWGVVLELVSRRSPSFALPLMVGWYELAASMLHFFAPPAMQERFVAKILEGDLLCAYCTSDDGTEVHFPCSAAVIDDGYELKGEVTAVVGGLLADFFLVSCRNEEDDSVGLYLLARDTPGLVVEPGAGSAIPGTQPARVKVDGVRLGTEARLLEDDGEHARVAVNNQRAVLVCIAVGRMQALANACVNYLETTIVDGEMMSARPHVRSTLGRLYAAIETSRTVTYRALDRLRWVGSDPKWDPQVTVAKCYVAEQAVQVAHDVIRLTGASGRVSDWGANRFLQDVLILIPSAGAQDSLHVALGKQVIHRRHHLRQLERERAMSQVVAWTQTLPWWKRLLVWVATRRSGQL